MSTPLTCGARPHITRVQGVRQAINTEDGRQKFQTVGNPLPTMFATFTGNRIIAAEVATLTRKLPDFVNIV